MDSEQNSGDGARVVDEGVHEHEQVESEARAMERGEKRVPVSEAIRYRKRAQEAEQRGTELESALEELREALEASRSSLLAAERGRGIDEVLVELRAVDMETARAMLEREVGGGDDPEGIRKAALALKRGKPFLFRGDGTVVRGSSMGGRPKKGRGGVESHARVAAETGDRGALMRYLRARREKGSA